MFTALNGWRFILSLIMVWFHMPIWKPENSNFGNPIVTFFFILSGFLITLSYKDSISSKRISIKDFIVKRSATIFPIQWLFTLLFVCFSIIVVSYWAIPFHMTLTQSLIPLWEIDFTLNTPCWFLSSLFVCYIITPFLFRLQINRNRFTLLYLAVLIFWHTFVNILPDTIGQRWLCYINPFARMLNYGCGIILAMYWSEIKKFIEFIARNKTSQTLIEVIVIFLFSISLLNIPLFGLNKLLGIGSVLLDIFICLFISVFCVSDGILTKILKLPFFDKLGKIAIAIYMCHTFIIHYTLPLLEQSVLLYIFISYTTIIIISFILEKYYCRYTKNIFMRYLGK